MYGFLSSSPSSLIIAFPLQSILYSVHIMLFHASVLSHMMLTQLKILFPIIMPTNCSSSFALPSLSRSLVSCSFDCSFAGLCHCLVYTGAVVISPQAVLIFRFSWISLDTNRDWLMTWCSMLLLNGSQHSLHLAATPEWRWTLYTD